VHEKISNHDSPYGLLEGLKVSQSEFPLALFALQNTEQEITDEKSMNTLEFFIQLVNKITLFEGERNLEVNKLVVRAQDLFTPLPLLKQDIGIRGFFRIKTILMDFRKRKLYSLNDFL